MEQDVLMAPLLSIPTAVKELLYRYGMLYMIPILGLYGCTIACAALASKRLIPRVSSRPRRRSCPTLTVSSVGGTCMPSSHLIEQRVMVMTALLLEARPTAIIHPSLTVSLVCRRSDRSSTSATARRTR